MVPVDALVASLRLEAAGEGAFRAANVQAGHPVVFGGQLLAQSLVAAARQGRRITTMTTVFARGASPAEPLDIAVVPVHDGRTFASATVVVRQAGRTITHSLALLTADDPDLIRHGGAGELPAVPDLAPGADMQTVWADGVDVDDPAAVGPAEADVWVRFPGAPADLGGPLLAFASDLFCIGTAMRPHAGVGQSQAHRTVATSVVGHTLTLHEEVDAADWLLLRLASPWAGRGRAHGRADVFARDGSIVASFVQDSMIRAMGDPA